MRADGVSSTHKACWPQRWRLLGSSAEQAAGNCHSCCMALLVGLPFSLFLALSIHVSFAGLWAELN